MRLAVFLAASVAAPLLYSQIGQYPGGYPGQQGGGLPMPFPRRGKTKNTGKDTPAEALTRSRGTLRKVDAKDILVDTADGRQLDFHRTTKTKFYRDSKEIQDSDLKVGDEIAVESSQDQDGYLIAHNVYFEKSGTTAEQAPAKSDGSADQVSGDNATAATAAEDTPPPIPRDKDDPGPPELKRGAPHRKVSADESTDNGPVATADRPTLRNEAPKAEQRTAGDPIIDKARQAAEAFSEKLPNYVCKEYMARFASQSRPVDWRPLDVVSANLVYEGGKESYRGIAINGKAVNKPIEEIGGSWSTGEYGSMLRDLFSPATAADFHPRGESVIAGVTAREYNFTVDQPHSHWHVQAPSQSINPAYKGSVWIDPESGRVLRIELQARRVPEEFPLDTIESAVDYENILIGGSRFLLPVHSESLSCQRGSAYCQKNAIDFRNYHKYEAESAITFETK